MGELAEEIATQIPAAPAGPESNDSAALDSFSFDPRAQSSDAAVDTIEEAIADPAATLDFCGPSPGIAAAPTLDGAEGVEQDRLTESVSELPSGVYEISFTAVEPVEFLASDSLTSCAVDPESTDGNDSDNSSAERVDDSGDSSFADPDSAGESPDLSPVVPEDDISPVDPVDGSGSEVDLLDGTTVDAGLLDVGEGGGDLPESFAEVESSDLIEFDGGGDNAAIELADRSEGGGDPEGASDEAPEVLEPDGGGDGPAMKELDSDVAPDGENVGGENASEALCLESGGDEPTSEQDEKVVEAADEASDAAGVAEGDDQKNSIATQSESSAAAEEDLVPGEHRGAGESSADTEEDDDLASRMYLDSEDLSTSDRETAVPPAAEALSIPERVIAPNEDAPEIPSVTDPAVIAEAGLDRSLDDGDITTTLVVEQAVGVEAEIPTLAATIEPCIPAESPVGESAPKEWSGVGTDREDSAEASGVTESIADALQPARNEDFEIVASMSEDAIGAWPEAADRPTGPAESSTIDDDSIVTVVEEDRAPSVNHVQLSELDVDLSAEHESAIVSEGSMVENAPRTDEALMREAAGCEVLVLESQGETVEGRNSDEHHGSASEGSRKGRRLRRGLFIQSLKELVEGAERGMELLLMQQRAHRLNLAAKGPMEADTGYTQHEQEALDGELPIEEWQTGDTAILEANENVESLENIDVSPSYGQGIETFGAIIVPTPSDREPVQAESIPALGL